MRIINRVIFSCIALVSVAWVSGFSLRYNNSQSLPKYLYFSMPVKNPKIDQIVTFTLPESRVKFAKIIVGIAGDNIKVNNQKIYLNGVEKGAIVEPFQPINEGIIPEGFYFVMGIHPESFDSRYQSFGLIPEQSIRARLCPIF